MKKRITDNLGLKILALMCAVVLWFIVVSLNDPVIYNRFSDIPVKIINADAVTSQGKVYEVLDGTDTIDVTVYAKRSIIESIGRENIVAVADMQELTFMDTVSIKLSTNKNNDKLDSIKSNIENLKVQIENMQKIQMVVETATIGEPAEGYMIGEVRTDQNLVQLSGPESVISLVNKAVVEVGIDGITTDIKTEAPLRLYDADGNLIEDGSIAASVNKFSVGVSILQTKTVPINLNVTGTPAVGYELTGKTEYSPETVRIAGKASILKNVASIEIPQEVLDVTGLTSNLATSINVKQYLPDGVSLADSTFSGKISVTIAVEKEVEAPFEMPKGNIAILNVPADMEAEIIDENDNLQVQLTGLTQYLNTLQGAQLTGMVDLNTLITNTEQQGENENKLQAGNYSMEVTLSLPEGVRVKQPLLVNISLKEKEE